MSFHRTGREDFLLPKPETKHITTRATVTEDGDGQGLIEAVFSVFGNIDSAGDVVMKSAFTDGQEVPMVWSHDWDKPIGKGVVKVTSKAAVFKGQLWLDTEDGMQAFRKIRNAGNLQEFSWGFQITDAEPGVVDGQDVRLVKGAELFEVSPVLVGANRQTHLLSIKAAEKLVDAVVAEVAETPAPDPDPQPSSEPVSEPEAPDQEDSQSSNEPEGKPEPSMQDRADFARGDVDKLVDDLKTASLTDADTRKALELVRQRLAYACGEIEAALKRTDAVAQAEPRNLLAQFQRLDALLRDVPTTPIRRG